MKKIILSVATLMALRFKDQPTDGLDASDVEAKILDLSGNLTKAEDENKALKLAAQTAKEAQEAAAKLAVENKVKLAITQGKFGADKEAEMVALGLASEPALDTVIASIPAKQNFAGNVTTPSGSGSEVKTIEDFQKLSLEAQLAFKTDNPNEYQNLVKSIK